MTLSEIGFLSIATSIFILLVNIIDFVLTILKGQRYTFKYAKTIIFLSFGGVAMVLYYSHLQGRFL